MGIDCTERTEIDVRCGAMPVNAAIVAICNVNLISCLRVDHKKAVNVSAKRTVNTQNVLVESEKEETIWNCTHRLPGRKINERNSVCNVRCTRRPNGARSHTFDRTPLSN